MDINAKKLLIQKTLYNFIKEGGNARYLFNEEVSYTFEETVRVCSHTAKFLHDNGIEKGTLVALRATRSLETYLLVISLHILGAVCAMCDAHEGVKAFITHSGVDISPQFYLTNESHSADLSCGEGWRLISGVTSQPILFAAGTEAEARWAEKTEARVQPTDPALILFTSGSTGKKKACVLCQQNYITAALDGSDVFKETSEDVAALVLPLYHILDFCVPVYAAVDRHSVFFPKSAAPEATLKNIETYGITVIHAVPSYLLSLAEKSLTADYDLSSFKKSLIAGGPYTPEQAEFIEKTLKISLIPVYGMSEYVAISTCSYEVDAALRNHSVGQFYPLNDGVILGADGKRLGVGERGEICVRGYDKMLHYYNDPEATAELIDENGYVHTGDLGFVDTNGFLHITGRKKDIIIRNGVNISSVDIERKMLSLPTVKDVAVVGISDKKQGEVPAAAVVLRNAALSEEELFGQASAVLNKLEMIAKIMVLSEIPLTASGKKDKQAIKKYFI